MMAERYRKMLVAVDGSESSKNAFRQACSVARDNNSWITVLTVIPPYYDQFQALSIKEKVGIKLREEGDKILNDIKEIALKEDVYIKTILTEGNPVDSIIQMLEDNNFDLIVMGRHGKTGLDRALLGSVATRVLSLSKKDVLIVPKDAVIQWNSILVPTDGSIFSMNAVDKAIKLAKAYGSKIIAVSAVDVTEEFQAQAPDAVERLIKNAKGFIEEVRKKTNDHGIETEGFVKEGDTYRVITDFAINFKVGIIIMGSQGKTGVKRIIIGSVAEKVIGYAPCPVLVVKSQLLNDL